MTTLAELQLPGDITLNEYAILMHHASRVDQRAGGKIVEVPNQLLQSIGWEMENGLF